MIKIFDILLELENKSKNLPFSVSQNDLNAIRVNMTILSDGIPLNIAGTTSARIAIKKPSGLSVIQDCEIVDSAKGKISVILSTQAYTEIGKHDAEIYLYEGDTVSVTSTFSYTSKKAILDNGTVTSTNDWQSINNALIRIADVYTKSEADVKLTGKVDIVAGKSLSTNDYDNTEKSEVAKVKDKADKSYVDTQLADKAPKKDLVSYVNAKSKTQFFNQKHYFLYDGFNNRSSTTTLGNIEIFENVNTYTILGTNSPVWGCDNSGNAYCVSVSTPARTIASVETNESDCVVESYLNVAGTNSGMAFRITDINNFWFCTVSADNSRIEIGKYVAGSVTVLKTITKSFSAGKLSIRMNGKKIEVYMAGFLQARLYDSFNSTASIHGLYTRGDSPNYRWYWWAVKPLQNIPLNFKDDFESSLKWYWATESAAGIPYAITFNTDIKKIGSRSLRLEVNKSDPEASVGKHRSEITLPSEAALEEHWYGVSVYLPKGGIEDYSLDTEAEIITQFHNTPDTSPENVSPSLCLQTLNGHYYINHLYDEDRTNSQATLNVIGNFDLGSYEDDKGTWVDWTFHIRWGFADEHNPITEVYKNGVLVYEANGIPNAINDTMGIYWKIGIYKWTWDDPKYNSIVSKRVVYYDDVWMK